MPWHGMQSREHELKISLSSLIFSLRQRGELVKLAIYFNRDGLGCRKVVEKMCRAQSLHPSHSYQMLDLKNGALGYIRTSDQFSSIPHFLQSSQGNILAISGVPLDMRDSLNQTLLSIVSRDYQEAGKSLSGLDGAFAAVFWDNVHQKLVIVTDFLGSQPLYKFADQQSVLWATDLKGITSSGLLDLEMDPTGWGAFLSLGYYVGSRTALRKIELMEPGSITIYDPTEKSTSIQSYWAWDEPQRDLKLKDVDTGRLVDQLDQHAKASLEHDKQTTLLLSGGFDSRLILCVLRRAGIKPRIAICEHPDEGENADGQYALQIARQFKLEAELIRPGESFYSSDDYVDYLIMNEVTTPSLNLFIARLAAHFKPEMRAIWEGVGPGNSLYADNQMPGGFKHHFQLTFPKPDSIVWRAAARVFAPSLVEQMVQGVKECLDQESRKYPDDEYGLRYFLMLSRVRNRLAANPFKVYANLVLPFTPGLSKDFQNYAMSIPRRVKHNYALYFKIFRDHFPEAMKVPWCSMGVLFSPNGKIGPIYKLYLYIEKRGLLEAIKKYPFVESVARKVGKQPRISPENSLVRDTMTYIDPGHPDLHADGIRTLQSDFSASDPVTRSARAFLFYWQIWRWVMEGQLTMPRQYKTTSWPSIFGAG
jgi:hypothetical protein